MLIYSSLYCANLLRYDDKLWCYPLIACRQLDRVGAGSNVVRSWNRLCPTDRRRAGWSFDLPDVPVQHPAGRHERQYMWNVNDDYFLVNAEVDEAGWHSGRAARWPHTEGFALANRLREGCG